MKIKSRHIHTIALIILALVYLCGKFTSGSKNAMAIDGLLYVSRVVDGDTLKLSNGERVRLIGIDTPEVHYSEKLIRDARKSHKDIKTIQALGRKASLFTKELCCGKKVRLEFDVERRDRYGRTLAYAYLEDGTFVNAKIIEEGYGQVLTIPPNVKHAEYFARLEREAREKGKGLWG